MLDNRKNVSGWKTPLFSSLLVALAARVLVSTFLPGPLRPDEIYQYLEPALRLVTGQGVVTWEWHEGIRSWLVPGFISGLFRLSHGLGLGFSVRFVRAVFAVLSLPLVALFVWTGWRQAGARGAWLFGMAGALWPDMVSAGFRTLGECLGGNMLAAGVLLGTIALDRNRNGTPAWRGTLFLLCGLSLGSAMAVRFQFAPAVLVAAAFLVWKGGWRVAGLLGLGLMPPVATLGVVDALTLRYPYQSVFHNYHVNQTLGVADTYGKRAFLYFPVKYMELWGPGTLALAFLCMRGARLAAFPLAMALVIVLYHSGIRHKEISFVYPAIPLLVVTAAAGLARPYTERNGYAPPFHQIVPVEILFCLLTFLSTYAPLLRQKSLPIQMESLAGRQPDFCGLALMDPPLNWAHFGGYSFLPPHTSFRVFSSRRELEESHYAYSHILAGKDFDMFPSVTRQIRCSRDDRICLYQISSHCDVALNAR